MSQSEGEYRNATLSLHDYTLTEFTHMHVGVWFGWTQSGQSFTMVRHGNDNNALSVELGRIGNVYWNDSVPRHLTGKQLLDLCGFSLQEEQEEQAS